MSDISIFQDKSRQPDEADLIRELKDRYLWWQQICGMVFMRYPMALTGWNYPGAKYGWSFRMNDKKRAIIYLLPRAGYFKAAFVFGDKAVDAIVSSSVSDTVKTRLLQARKYAEGRGIRIDVLTETDLADVERLIEIKLKY